MKPSTSKKIQVTIVSMSVLGLAAFFGCAAFQEALIPCYIDPAIFDFIGVDPNEFPKFLPWTTIFDADRVDMQMDFVYQWEQTKTTFRYDFLKGIHSFHYGGAQALQKAIFSPTGLIGALFPAATAGTLGALFVPRRKDKKKIADLEKKVNGK